MATGAVNRCLLFKYRAVYDDHQQAGCLPILLRAADEELGEKENSYEKPNRVADEGVYRARKASDATATDYNTSREPPMPLIIRRKW